jgi:C4-dicarboxylate-specific signal transduction histidine kinase
MAGAITDITDRRRAEEERIALEARVLHAQKLESLGVLAGGIAHDFNNLLVGVLGNADLALMDLDGNASAAEHLAMIVTAAKRASELTKQMLAYSGKGKFVVEPVDLSQLV